MHPRRIMLTWNSSVTNSFLAPDVSSSGQGTLFRAMFNHEIRESANNTVDLPDIQVKTLKNLLKYFYTDTINEVDLELLKIADQYLLKDLKDYCESVLSKSVQVQDTAKIFVLVRSITASKLANACLDVITANYKEVFEKLPCNVLSNSFYKF